MSDDPPAQHVDTRGRPGLAGAAPPFHLRSTVQSEGIAAVAAREIKPLAHIFHSLPTDRVPAQLAAPSARTVTLVTSKSIPLPFSLMTQGIGIRRVSGVCLSLLLLNNS